MLLLTSVVVWLEPDLTSRFSSVTGSQSKVLRRRTKWNGNVFSIKLNAAVQTHKTMNPDLNSVFAANWQLVVVVTLPSPHEKHCGDCGGYVLASRRPSWVRIVSLFDILTKLFHFWWNTSGEKREIKNWLLSSYTWRMEEELLYVNIIIRENHRIWKHWKTTQHINKCTFPYFLWVSSSDLIRSCTSGLCPAVSLY